MMRKTLFVKNHDDFENAKIISNLRDYDIFSFDIETHRLLESKKIPHKIAERYLAKDDHEKIYKNTIKFYNWYDALCDSESLEYEKINLLSIYDTAELHHILIREIYAFFVVKRIVEKNSPEEILCNSELKTIVNAIDETISCNILSNLKNYSTSPFESYSFSFSLFGTTLPIRLSRIRYTKIKNFLEQIIGTFFGLHFDIKNKNESILLLEFNPEQYPHLLANIKKNIIFLNQRRPAIWNWNSIRILKKHKCKILNPLHYLTSNEKTWISQTSNKYLKELEKLWKKEKIFTKIFLIEGCSIWKSLSETLLRIYKQRLEDYITLVYFNNHVLSNLNITCILSLNVFGETEKVVLSGNRHISSILLEHGFTNYVPELSLFDISNMYPLFKDKIAVWGPLQKKYLKDQHNIDDSRILIPGSPRHDDFFNIKNNKQSSKKSILITPGMLDQANGIYDTDYFLRYEKLLDRIFSFFKNRNDIDVIVKLHPSSQKNNQYIKNFICKIAPNVELHQFTSILDELQSCDFMLNIYTELVPSTVLLEGMILKKPIMNISMIDESYDFEFLKDNAVLNVSDKSNFETDLNEFLSNSTLQNKLIQAATKHVTRYLAHPGKASKTLSTMINSIEKND